MVKNVWVLMAGENSEGGNVLGIFHRKPSEARVTSSSKPHFGPWVLKEQSIKSMRWVSGCDFLELFRHEVQ